MHIQSAKRIMLRTHMAAIHNEERANAILLEGGPGIAKSEGTFQSVEDLAAALNEPCALVQEMLATYTSPDVRGFMMPVKGANGGLDTVFSTPAWYPQRHNVWVVEPNGTWHQPGTWDGNVPRYGKVFLDEFGQAEDEVKKPAAELMLHGRIGTCELPIGYQVVAAQNRTSDRSGVMRELMFLVNRRCRLKIDASLPAWLEWVTKQPTEQQPHYLTISFAQKNPDIVFRDMVPEGTEPFCTPRTLCLMDKGLKAIRSDEDIKNDMLPLDSDAREYAAGWIGDGAAAQFYTHLKYADELPDVEDIEKDPAKAKLPEKRDAQMVCAYMIAHHVNDKNAKHILSYTFRLNIEMQVLAIRAISAHPERAKAIVSVPEYTSWLIKNAELLKASQS